MKKIISYLSLVLTLLCTFPLFVQAKDTKVYINLSTLESSTNQKSYQSIKEYADLESFLKDYESGNLPDVYITGFLFDGVSSVKSPDLDDFIEAGSNDTEIKTLEIKTINIHKTGNYEFTGEITGAMIAVNTNGVKGNIHMILNGATLDTDSKKAPAIYVYNKDKNNTDCNVTIETAKNSKNYIEGGKLKKVSLVGSDELDKYTSYYSGSNLTNYNQYSSYYGIYTSDETKNILFATVQADREDLQDGDPYVFYKASGAISSDIDLTFEGTGYLEVTSKNKEGIETKGNLTFSGGTGDYKIYASDDCLNTTTANSSGTTVRNDIVIDVHSLLASVSVDAEEGDAIDSNGKLTINGGTIYAFAHPNSGDAGLDSANGIFLNGGTIIATGNMTDPISSESKQNVIYVAFNQKIQADTLIAIKDEKENVIMAFQTGRTITNLLYSSPNLNTSTYSIYTGGEINGEEENGLYTKINRYTGGEEIAYREVNTSSRFSKNQNSTSDGIGKIFLIEIGILVVFLMGIVTAYLLSKKKENG